MTRTERVDRLIQLCDASIVRNDAELRRREAAAEAKKQEWLREPELCRGYQKRLARYEAYEAAVRHSCKASDRILRALSLRRILGAKTPPPCGWRA